MTSTMIHYIPDVIRASNATTLPLLDVIMPTSPNYPFYQTFHQSIFPWISDKHLSLLVPTLFYWSFSLLFHFIDTMQFPYFEKRRIHESPEVMARNKCTVREVVKAVMIQHIVQTLLGLAWFPDEDMLYHSEVKVEHLERMIKLAPKVAKGVLLLLGPRTGEQVLRSYGEGLVQWVYWWGIPAGQLVLAFFILDTWQYFWHRAFHTSKFLYRHIHSIHHRLYVPYAFGALYNHPVEGFVLDSLGSIIAHELSGMTIRQATVFFGISMIKTVDDHAGYRLAWDPCQWLFPNNADYHDIHHQMYGLKANFSQPYFVNWDVLLRTRMTRSEANHKTRKSSKIAVPATHIEKTE